MSGSKLKQLECHRTSSIVIYGESDHGCAFDFGCASYHRRPQNMNGGVLAHEPVGTEPENMGEALRTAGVVAKSVARRWSAPMFVGVADVGVHDA